MTVVARSTREDTIFLPEKLLTLLRLREGDTVKAIVEGQTLRVARLEAFLNLRGALADDDLAILLDVVALLKQQRTNELTADIRRAARRRAMELRGLPRDQLAAQLRAVGERIRAQAITSGTAIDRDWQSY